MGKSLNKIALDLKANTSKVQLIYAFNGTGKTRLSKEFKALISTQLATNEDDEQQEISDRKILYYNAFTEDLFYWDNDLNNDSEPKLKIHSNEFTKWILETQGQEATIIQSFKNYTNEYLTPNFKSNYSEVIFSYNKSEDVKIDHIKISKGEESNFIWCVFYAIFKQIIEDLNEIIEAGDLASDLTSQFDKLEYIYIDDPVTSLDENHLIQLGVDLATMIKKSKSDKLKFIITTHNPLFYNVLYNELKVKSGFFLDKDEDEGFVLDKRFGDSNKTFSYHLHLKRIIENAIENNQIERFHFNLIRNLYEKTANFLGYNGWAEILPDDKKLYHTRITNFTSHSTLSTETIPDPTPEEKKVVEYLYNHLIDNYSYWKEAQR
ncbi:AAA family ATPase [Fusibacter ferrireducens]|uniref:AAA family ATPase n=1 Tax=Fusibacter ferrireducens TaxID=2785058 RepID=A0ABS0A0Q0_9FIRM|nr:AAA family ATPase [Fusibacter ferrireducens]MBF4696018.1 AAA family ATPase [Fusibacter ferrireducens]